VVALVPVRGLGNGKTRLAGSLPTEARAALTERMLRGVIRAALDAGVIDVVVVISPDPAALAAGGEVDPAVVGLPQDAAAAGLNAAVEQGRAWAMARGAAALLVLFGDLPLLTGADVRALVNQRAAVVVASDRHGTGTNALLLRIGGATAAAAARFAFGFGEGSAARHAAEADRLGLPFAAVESLGTAFDLDTPADWRALLVVADVDGSLLEPSLARGGEGDR